MGNIAALGHNDFFSFTFRPDAVRLFYPPLKNICFLLSFIIFRIFRKINSFFNFIEINLYIYFPFCYSVIEVISMSFFGENLKKPESDAA